MTICVKQKKLVEEGGRVNEERGLWVGSRGHSCVRWLPGLPVLTDNLFDLCVCVYVCVHLFFLHKAGCGGVKVSTLGGGKHIQTSHWSFSQNRGPSVLLISCALFLWVLGLTAALLPDGACIRASSGGSISRVCHCSWLTSLQTPTSIWTWTQRHMDKLPDQQESKQADSNKSTGV